jgi:hypothetical protein
MTTIHYRGNLLDPMRRKALVRDLEKYAQERGWDTIPVDDTDAGLTGIILQPTDKLEVVPFLFDAQGQLHALGDLIAPGGEPILIVSVKTHYAGVAGHIAFVDLLRRIRDNHMSDLVVTDESGYWEHNDAAQLQAYFDRLDRLAKSFSGHLAHDVAPASDGDIDNLESCIRLAAKMSLSESRSDFEH